ncbi:MAG: serine hydrolase [Actinomycetota bacterium]
MGTGEPTDEREDRRLRRRLLPAVLASGLLLTGIAAAGRPAPDQAGGVDIEPAREADAAAPSPRLAVPQPTRAPTPTPTASPTPESAASPTPTPTPTVTPTPTPDPDLTPLLEALVARVDAGDDGVVSVTVVHDSVTSVLGGDDPVVSASAAKLYWAVAAADRAEDPTRLSATAAAVFGWSDNDAAGRLIDAVGGVDAVNAYTSELGLDATSLSAWSYGAGRFASDRSERGTLNTTSTADLAAFLDAFASGELLDPTTRAVVEDWMRQAPDDLASSAGLDGILTDALPASVAADSMHKAGWLPPGCCRSIDHVLVAAGIVPLSDGGWFSIAVAVQDTEDFDAAVAWIPQVVCEVWADIEGGACPPQG